MTWSVAATGFALLVLVVTALDLFIGSRRIALLRELPPALGDELPSLSIVIAARNEERNLEEALRSLLALDYPRLEIVLVDDRSEDRTGEIVARLAGEFRSGAVALRPIRVDALPDGWIGKNHALWSGARAASGELLLFSDADIIMRPDTLRRAVAYVLQQRLGHLAIGPEVRMPGRLLEAVGLTGTLFFTLATRPWRARRPRSRAHIGIGAFNLVWREKYLALGGHQAISLRPDDDMKLGKLFKRGGARQDFVAGKGLLWVEWYASLGEMVRGLTKNSFAALDYSVAAVAAGTFGPLLIFVWPPVALVATSGTTQLLALAAVTLVLLMHGEAARVQRGSPLLSFFYPLVALLFIYMLLRSTVLTLARGGIEWRGTHYPLDMLRSQRR